MIGIASSSAVAGVWAGAAAGSTWVSAAGSAARKQTPTSRPVALRMERVFGPLLRAHYVTEELPGTQNLLELCAADPKDALAPSRRLVSSRSCLYSRSSSGSPKVKAFRYLATMLASGAYRTSMKSSGFCFASSKSLIGNDSA